MDFSNSSSHLTGLNAIIELKRIIHLEDEEKPYMIVFTTDPKHPGGVIYEGVKLCTLGTHCTENGKIEKIAVQVTQAELGYQNFTWHPEGVAAPKNEKEIQYVQIFVYERRVGMGRERLEQFLSELPNPPDPRVVENQLYLESYLPRVDSESSYPRLRF